VLGGALYYDPCSFYCFSLPLLLEPQSTLSTLLSPVKLFFFTSMQTLLGSQDDDKHPAILQVEQLGYVFLMPSVLTVLITESSAPLRWVS